MNSPTNKDFDFMMNEYFHCWNQFTKSVTVTASLCPSFLQQMSPVISEEQELMSLALECIYTCERYPSVTQKSLSVQRSIYMVQKILVLPFELQHKYLLFQQ